MNCFAIDRFATRPAAKQIASVRVARIKRLERVACRATLEDDGERNDDDRQHRERRQDQLRARCGLHTEMVEREHERNGEQCPDRPR